jgi:hypothetical protein
VNFLVVYAAFIFFVCYVIGAVSAEYVKLKVCAYDEEKKSFVLDGKAVASNTYFYANPDKVVAVLNIHDESKIKCTKIILISGLRVYVEGSTEYIKDLLEHENDN